VLREHVEDYEREAENSAWDSRDLEQIRKLKRFAPPKFAPTLDRLEASTLYSNARLGIR
jgi:hypothetical protein